ncbi:26950_t:CDS:2, partial [Gigaspora margarita]
MVEEINGLIKCIHTLLDREYWTLEVQDIYTDKFTVTKKQKDKRDIINGYINKRYNNFLDNTTRMIDSVLGRHMDVVTYDNIRTPSGIVTEAEEEATRHHFCSWTKLNPINQEKWKKWKQEYEPIKDINTE